MNDTKILGIKKCTCGGRCYITHNSKHGYYLQCDNCGAAFGYEDSIRDLLKKWEFDKLKELK